MEENNAWHELNLLLANCRGKILDNASGTGLNMSDFIRIYSLDIHGCDFSDFLSDKATARGFDRSKLTVCNASLLPFDSIEIDYSYSIGSLESVDLRGLENAIAESARVTRVAVFHQALTSRNERDNGWIEPSQFYWNNSSGWRH